MLTSLYMRPTASFSRQALARWAWRSVQDRPAKVTRSLLSGIDANHQALAAAPEPFRDRGKTIRRNVFRHMETEFKQSGARLRHSVNC